MKLKIMLGAALLLVLPTAALAAPGLVTVSASMRAGPGPGFPMVDRIPAGAHINVYGCIRGDAWCDVSWSGDRGWISSRYLEYYYRNRYVYLPDYVDVIDVPEVPFVLDTYWSSYYSGRPWYHRRAYWSSYWQSHEGVATRGPIGGPTRFGRTETTTTGIGPGTTREQGLANVRSGQRRMIRENGPGHGLSSEHQTIGTARATSRFSAAPANGRVNAHGNATTHVNANAHLAQPGMGRADMGRMGGAPANAHAQMGAPHAAGPTPNAGAAAHINAAPHGGGPAGGPPGRERH